MTEETLEPLASYASENSFVILGPGSFNSLSNDAPLKHDDSFCQLKTPTLLNDVTKSSESDMTPSRHSTMSSVLESNAQDKVNELLRENYQLKETLSQNNLAIKSQLNTFFMWQQEVLKTHESHKQKFLETKNLILKLKAENLGLKKQLENKTQSFSCFEERVTTEAYDHGYKQQIELNIKEIEELKQENKRFECLSQDLEKKNERLIIENDELRRSITDLRKAISKLNKQLEDAERVNVHLKQKISDSQISSESNLPSYVLPNSEARAQISNLLKQLDEERSKVVLLKQELSKTKHNSIVLESENADEELSACINQLNEIDASLNKQSQRFNGISSWINLTEESFMNSYKTSSRGAESQVEPGLAELKNNLQQEKNVSKQKEEDIKQMQDQFTKLLSDYKELEGKMNSMESLVQNNQKYQKEVADLSEKVQSKDEELLLKKKECDQLIECIKKLNLECEEVALLKVQNEVYKTDFVEEREAREKIANEKEEMAEQIRFLNCKITELEAGKESKNCQSSSLEKKQKYVCPKCMFAFSDFKQCQEHVDDCLDQHFYP